MKFVYAESQQDMAQLEEELLKIGSYFINNFEYVLAQNDVLNDQKHEGGEGEMNYGAGKTKTRPSSLVDRPEIVRELYEKELDFQFAKVELIEALMESYQHVCDPVESVRLLQTIVDTMA